MNFSIRISPAATDREADIARAYWKTNDAGAPADKVIDVGNRFGMSSHETTTLAKQVSSLVSEDVACRECSEPLEVAGRAMWSYFKDAHKQASWTCGSCISAAADIEHQKLVEALKERATRAIPRAPAYQDLSVEQKIYLLALYERGSITGVNIEHNGKRYGFDAFSWSTDMDNDILSRLESNGVIAICPHTKGNVVFNEGGKIKADRCSLDWIVLVERTSLEDDASQQEIYQRLKEDLYSPSFLEGNAQEVSDLSVKTVRRMIAELARSMASYHWSDSYLAASAVYPLLDRLLDNYTVSQALYIFHDASQRVEADVIYHNRRNEQKLFFGFVDEMIARLVRSGWEAPYLRENTLEDLPEPPLLGKVLLENILGLDNETYRFRVEDLLPS